MPLGLSKRFNCAERKGSRAGLSGSSAVTRAKILTACSKRLANRLAAFLYAWIGIAGVAVAAAAGGHDRGAACSTAPGQNGGEQVQGSFSSGAPWRMRMAYQMVCLALAAKCRAKLASPTATPVRRFVPVVFPIGKCTTAANRPSATPPPPRRKSRNIVNSRQPSPRKLPLRLKHEAEQSRDSARRNSTGV